MAFGKLINLFALSSLAVLVCNLNATPVTALAHDGHHMVKVRRAHGHDAVLKRKRDSSKRCKPRPSSAPAEIPAAETPAADSTADAAPVPTPTSSDSDSEGSDQNSPAPAPAPAPEPSPSSPPSNPPVNNSGRGKVGLAWPNGNDPSLANFVTPNVRFIYTWSESCPPNAADLGLECMPMLWGTSNAQDPNREQRFRDTVVPGYAHYVLGFNEVNEPGQANLDVDTAVAKWWELIEPLHEQGYQLLAPCTSSAPNGFDWVQEFRAKCTGCHIDGYTLHYYGTSAEDMINYIEQWQAEFGGPLHITEFACQNFNTAHENNGQQCSEEQVWQFYSTIVNYMESNDNIISWMPFGAMHDMVGVNPLNQLMDSSGQPTALGHSVINLSF